MTDPSPSSNIAASEVFAEVEPTLVVNSLDLVVGHLTDLPVSGGKIPFYQSGL